MTDRETIDVVLRSLDGISCTPLELMELYFEYLFEFDPELAKLFPGDMAVHCEDMLDLIILMMIAFENEYRLVVTFEAFGARHRRMGILPENYDTMRLAMLEAVAWKTHDWSDDVEAAWNELYADVVDMMTIGSIDYAHDPSPRRMSFRQNTWRRAPTDMIRCA